MESEATTIAEVHRSPLSEEMILDLIGSPPNTNRQLFENSELALDPVVEAEQRDPDRLFSANDDIHIHDRPNLAIIHEKAEHRVIVYMKAQGLSNAEIAERSGYTQPWLSQLTRQPWFRLRLVQELKDAGLDKIQQVLKANALDSVFTLVDLRDDVTAPKAVRKACADSLLDRYIGKARQTVQVDDQRTPSSAEIVAVNKEIEQIENQLKESTNGKTEL